MNWYELVLIAVGLSMDAFAVAICKGLSMEKSGFGKALVVGLYFGVFQAAMPLAGYYLGSHFAARIEAYDHWIAFILLVIIGGKMVWESLRREKDGEACEETSLRPAVMLPLAVATSIDALAIGVSFAFLQVQIVPAVTLIGVVTLVLSMAGVKIGNVFGARFKSKAEFAGGLILILMGVKILLEHLGILSF
ncbi:MAG: manganese efflux pump MntP family protein [Oscillospiraceae bacterium]|jgi:putative Mn2+ efflux pump MntP|nr:manganese efflux pump MntP family protein [Oscillospiraceae bacterium]